MPDRGEPEFAGAFHATANRFVARHALPPAVLRAPGCAGGALSMRTRRVAVTTLDPPSVASTLMLWTPSCRKAVDVSTPTVLATLLQGITACGSLPRSSRPTDCPSARIRTVRMPVLSLAEYASDCT